MTRAHLALAALFLFVSTAAIAEDVGTVASVRGMAAIGHGGVDTPATVGGVVQLGDELRTGPDGQLRVVFRDDSVIDLSESSALVVDDQVFNPSTSNFSSLMRLVSGKARALVGAYYRTTGAVYEVKTPTAVAGVRGTSFLVEYNPDTDATQVIGIHGQVQVRSVSERVGGAVYITAQEATTVFRNLPPTPPEMMEEQHFRREVEGLEVLSLGNLGGLGAGLAASHPVGAGATVSAPDRAPSAQGGKAGQLGRDQLRNAGDVAGQPLSVVGATRGSLGVPF